MTAISKFDYIDVLIQKIVKFVMKPMVGYLLSSF